MIVPASIADDRLASMLGRTSPLTKLGIALAWLVGLAATTSRGPPWHRGGRPRWPGSRSGASPRSTLVRAIAPLWVVALVVVVSNTVFGAANPDPAAIELLRFGPLRITGEAAGDGHGRGATGRGDRVGRRGLRADDGSTRLVDALVQQAHVPERFAYGALAAYQADPAVRARTSRPCARPAGSVGCAAAGIPACFSACSSWRSVTATGWPSPWTPGHSDLALEAAIGWLRWTALDLVTAIGAAIVLAGALLLANVR